jgi:hypothetical protein
VIAALIPWVIAALIPWVIAALIPVGDRGAEVITVR